MLDFQGFLLHFPIMSEASVDTAEKNDLFPNFKEEAMLYSEVYHVFAVFSGSAEKFYKF